MQVTQLIFRQMIFILRYTVAMLYYMYLDHKAGTVNTYLTHDHNTDYSLSNINSWNFYQHLKNYWHSRNTAILIVCAQILIGFLVTIIGITLMTCMVNNNIVDHSIFPQSNPLSVIITALIISRIFFHYKCFVTYASILQWSMIDELIAMIFNL